MAITLVLQTLHRFSFSKMHKVVYILKTRTSALGHSRWQHRLRSAPADGRHLPLPFLPDGSKRFSAAPNAPHRQSGGKSTPTATKSSEGQSGGKSKPLPATVPNASQSKNGGESDPNPSQNGLLKNYLMTIGACSAVAAAVLILYPPDWLKSFHFGDLKQSSESLPESAGQQEDLEPVLSNNFSTDVKEDKVENLKPLQGDEEQEFVRNDVFQVKGVDKVRQVEHDISFKGENLSKNVNDECNVSTSVQVTEQISQPHESQVLGNDADVHEKTSAVFLNGSNGGDVLVKVPDSDNILPDPMLVVISPIGEDKTASEEMLNDSFPSESLEKAECSKDVLDARPSISEAYHLPDIEGNHIHSLQEEQITEAESKLPFPRPEAGKEVPNVTGIYIGDRVTKQNMEAVRGVFDLLEVVHAAEHRQAEIDARLYEEDQRKMKEIFEQQLKATQAKELMYAEEADRLAKEVAVEKERGLIAIKLEREKADERVHRELRQKEEETNLKLRKSELLGRSQVASAIANEKVAYLEDMKDVKLQLEALHTAFYTRSEEARQSHTVHKLAIGTFAMEDAMGRGASVEKEVSLLLSATGGSGSDPLVDAALSSLSQEMLKEGSKTPAQLHQKFVTMTGALRELSLIPATGGGLLSHAAAKVVSALKVREEGTYPDGIEAVISQVQRYLADGKLADAADLLERGVQGSKAQDLVVEWVKHVRNRAAMEQVLSLLQAYATAIASSLA